MDAKTASDEKPCQEMVKSFNLGNSAKSNITDLEPVKDEALSVADSCVSSVDAVCSKKKVESDKKDALVIEQSMYNPMNTYYGYCYPGYDMQFAQWNGQGYVMGTDYLEMQQAVLQPDSGSLVYYMPGFQPGYNSCTTSLSPGAMARLDSQYQGQQTYVTSPVAPQPLVSPLYFPQSMGYGSEQFPVCGWDGSFWNFYNGNGYIGNYTLSTKPNLPEKLQQSRPDSKSSTVETTVSSPFLELPVRSQISNVPIRPVDKNYTPDLPMKPVKKALGQSRKLSLTKLSPNNYQGKGGMVYSDTSTSIENNDQNCMNTEKLTMTNKLDEFRDPDLLNKQHCGPRTSTSRNSSLSEVDQAGVPIADIGDTCGCKKVLIQRNNYNLSGFPTKYEFASFFVIKSYSEDDVHKSIKYNVWSSTPNGNKRLDIAFQSAQEQIEKMDSKCPVFLFFSVNASGQFCGVAEMIGRVDFHKNMDFWQQDKWTGFFPVKWHIVKDVPNSQFRHIVLENNDNKPVTNSRDTQEVKFPQGSEMLKVFKAFSSKTSILDDFGFYENRQKVMQDKRTKVLTAPLETKLEEATRVERSNYLKPIISSMEAIELDSSKMIENITQIDAV